MASKELNSIIQNKMLFSTTIATTTNVQTASLDLFGFESAEFFVSSHTAGPPPPDFNEIFVVMQDSDDNTVWGNVDPDFVVNANSDGDLTALGQDKKLGYVGHKRYVRLDLTGQDTGAAVTTTVVGFVGLAIDAPV